jgi:hypothetical protein
MKTKRGLKMDARGTDEQPNQEDDQIRMDKDIAGS